MTFTVWDVTCARLPVVSDSAIEYLMKHISHHRRSIIDMFTFACPLQSVMSMLAAAVVSLAYPVLSDICTQDAMRYKLGWIRRRRSGLRHQIQNVLRGEENYGGTGSHAHFAKVRNLLFERSHLRSAVARRQIHRLRTAGQ